jgi:toxin ParE1/3/4
MGPERRAKGASRVTIAWSRRAIAHLADLRAYIAHDNAGAANEVGRQLLVAVERLAEMPNMGRPGRVAGTRELVISGTPYVIPYRLRGARLEVIAVFHGRQRWPKRF